MPELITAWVSGSMTVEAHNNIEICSNWSTTEQSWRIGVSLCPRKTSYKMNPQCGRSNQLLQIHLPCQQSRNIIFWNWRRTRTSVYGTVRAILPIGPEESWYVCRVLHNIDRRLRRSFSYSNKNIVTKSRIYCNLINSNAGVYMKVATAISHIRHIYQIRY